MDYPTDFHLKAAYKVLQYLKRTIGKGILFQADNKLLLRAFADAYWATCVDTRR